MDISPEEFDSTYKTGKFLGEGAFGKVHQSTNVKNGLEFAIKSIQLPYSEEHRQLIMREKEAMRRMDHPNVVKCFHFTVMKERNHGESKTLKMVLANMRLCTNIYELVVKC